MNSMEGQHDNPAILVVDDDPDILAALRDLLEHEGYQVTCASTCGDARRGDDISIQCSPARCGITRWRRVLRIGHSQRAESLAPRHHSHGIYFTRIPGQITVSWRLFVREQTVRSGGASGGCPPGCSSSCIHRIDSLHHANNSLATLLSLLIRALFADEGLPSTSINDRRTGVNTKDYREDFAPENARLKTVRRPK